jgi:hypothetical protein
LWLGPSKPRKAQSRFALNQRFERSANQRTGIAQSAHFFCIGKQCVVQSDGCPHGASSVINYAIKDDLIDARTAR